MVWSFVWRWAAAAAVLCPLSAFGYGVAVMSVYGPDAPGVIDAATAGGMLVGLIVLTGTAGWAYFAARRLKR